MKKALSLILCIIILTLTISACSNEKDMAKPSHLEDMTKPSHLGEVSLKGKIVDVANLTIENLESIGYKHQQLSVWMTSFGENQAAGSHAKNGDSDIFISSLDYEIGKVTAIGIDEDSADVVLYNGITNKTTLSEIKELLKEFETKFFEGSFRNVYVFYDDTYSIVVEEDVESKNVETVFVVLSKPHRLNLTEEEKEQLKQEQIQTWFNTIPITDWPQYKADVNYAEDMSTIEIDGNVFNFMQLKMFDLIKIGYNNTSLSSRMQNCADEIIQAAHMNMSNEAETSTIEVMYNEQGYVYYMYLDVLPPEDDVLYDPDDIQVDFTVLDQIIPTMTKEEAKEIIGQLDISSELHSNDYILRNEEMSITIGFKDGKVSYIILLNHKLL